MRLRNIPRAAEEVAASPYVEQQPAGWQGRWLQRFCRQNPLHIEIGMGKGRFLMQMAALHPQINYIGFERYTSVLLRAVEKLAGAEPAPDNLLFVCEDASRLPEFFAPGEIGKIYLNFSDPWPKERHAARRLTSPAFLSRYGQVLAADGTIEFKTDNQDLFGYSLTAAQESGWQIIASTRDLHHDPLGQDNIMTEYEEKFSSKGNPICKMVLKKRGSVRT